MKNIFRAIGIVSLFAFGLFYTEKTSTVMKEMDNTMVEIKTVSGHYKEDATEAILSDKELIPGIAGREVDINKSYLNMKRMGDFDESLLIYKDLFPKIRLNKNYRNYIIGGNSKKNMVSLIILVEKNTSQKELDELLDLAKIKKVKLNFFIDGYWFEENNDKVSEIASLGHELGNLSYNRDYTDSSFIWMDTIIKKVTNKKFSFCYADEKNDKALEICSMYKNYTIKPNSIVTENPYSTIKKESGAGSFITLQVSKETNTQFPSIITHLKSKGLTVVTLKEHLKETR